MGLARTGAGAGGLVGEAGKDLRPGPAKVTEGKFSGENDRHELLKGPPGFLKSFSTGDLLKRDNTSETRMGRFSF